MNILVIEDDLEMLSIIEDILISEGHKVVATSDEHIAFEKFSHDPSYFNVIITDFKLQLSTGLEVASKIRELSPVPILIVSGMLPHGKDSLIREMKNVNLLSKPFNKQQLIKLINTALL